MMSTKKICRKMELHGEEMFDGFCIVGFVAGTGEACIIKPGTDQKTQLAVNQLLIAALNLQPEAKPPEEA